MEPTHLAGTQVGWKTRAQLHQLLISCGRSIQVAAIKQRVAEHRVVKGTSTVRYEFPRDRLRLGELVKLMMNMSAQEQTIEVLGGIGRLHGFRASPRPEIEPRVSVLARLRDEKPAQSLQTSHAAPGTAQALLNPHDFRLDFAGALNRTVDQDIRRRSHGNRCDAGVRLELCRRLPRRGGAVHLQDRKTECGDDRDDAQHGKDERFC